MLSASDPQASHLDKTSVKHQDADDKRPFVVKDHALLDAVARMPKIELHRHFEGSLRLDTMLTIARDFNLDIPNIVGDYTRENLRPSVQVMPDEPRTPHGFLGKFRVLRHFFRSPEVIRRLTHEIVADAAKDNIRYMELRFTPHALCKISGCTIADIVPLVCDVAMQTANEYDIQVRLIASMNRHEPVSLGEEVLAAALANQSRGIVGIDLAGDEANYTGLEFRPIFQRAKQAGLGITIHAGEWAGADSVWNAIGNLFADRVGHGINVLEDDAMVSVLAQRGVTLEVCPSSNVLSGVVDTLDAHPLHTLTQRGIVTTINTDDPSICAVTLSDEIALTIENSPITLNDVKDYTLRAARASFLPASERQALIQQFETWFKDPETQTDTHRVTDD
jgi:adenosine deaminase